MDEWVNKLQGPISEKKNHLPDYTPLVCYFLPLFFPTSPHQKSLPHCPPLGYFPRLLNKHGLSLSLLHLVRPSTLMLHWLRPSCRGSRICSKTSANTHEAAKAVGLTFECLWRSTVIFALNKIMPTRRICRWHLPFVKLGWQRGFMSH